MKVLIVEDETLAAETLADLLVEVDPAAEVLANTESIVQTVQWLQMNPSPDLILMDIHLSDGSAFAIFDAIRVEAPIIFTTAYDTYAIKAFKQNSVDYLLKPVKAEELRAALAKLRKWTRVEIAQYIQNMTQGLRPVPTYRDRLLVPVRDKLIPVEMKNVACFYTTEKNTRIYLKDGSILHYAESLEQLSHNLNPNEFFRANKQFLIARGSIRDITVWFDSRLLVRLELPSPEQIFISKNKASLFRSWMQG
ncbi:MAG: LytTR family DNA-binding domain-containing protein [Tannerella sp.]|jgi:DNA-binding LytR/AlgR family response regulator|nr:LytTR family DNA-binding domain-containing protein [Tannerella sp.]